MVPPDRFTSKVKELDSGCWEWQATKNAQGYGRFSICVGHYQKWYSAHRLAWEWANEPIPAGLCVLHRCDNPSCVNPSHLFLGTHKENALDRDQKRRRRPPAGEANGRAKLLEADVRAIRSSPLPNKELAVIYGVRRETIRAARAGVTWKTAA